MAKELKANDTEVTKSAKEESTLFETLYPNGYRPYKIKWFDITTAIVLLLIAFIAYVKTLTPSVCAGDSGELTTAVYNMGACHPPGYPLYGIMGKLFTFIPVKDIAFRVNMFSAFSAAGAVLFLYLILVKLLGFNRDENKPTLQIQIPAIAGSFLFAFSFTQWSQAVIGEVYALNALLSAAMLFVMLIWFEELIYYRKEKHLHFAERTTILLAFIMGLSLTDHQLPMWYIVAWILVLAIPAFIIIASEREKKFTDQIKQRLLPFIGFGAVLVIALALFYVKAYKPALILADDVPGILIGIFIIPVYLTVYTIANKITKPKENWVDRFFAIFMVAFWVFIFAMTIYLYMVIRARAIAPLAEPKPLSWGDTQTLDILFNHMLRKQYGTPSGNLNDMLGQLKAVFNFNVEQFNWINIIIAFVGVVYLFMKEKMWGLFTVIAVLLFSVVLVKFINFETDPRTLSFQEVFFIQEFLIIAIYISFGYQALLDLVTKGKKMFAKKPLGDNGL